MATGATEDSNFESDRHACVTMHAARRSLKGTKQSPPSYLDAITYSDDARLESEQIKRISRSMSKSNSSYFFSVQSATHLILKPW